MSSHAQQDKLRLGFLAAIDVPDRGHVGGLLVTNHFGRPLEFQCTTPVKPNRTQEILYGPTLLPYVLGELIGRTLIEKVGVKPHLVLTEREEVLELRHHVSMPVVCFDDVHADAATTPPVTPTTVSIGRQRLRFHAAHPNDRNTVEKSAALLPNDANLREPFERVREALQETLRMGASR